MTDTKAADRSAALHEWKGIDATTARMRVPGGWFYTSGSPDDPGGAAFVPDALAGLNPSAVAELVEAARYVQGRAISYGYDKPKALDRLEAALDKLEASDV